MKYNSRLSMLLTLVFLLLSTQVNAVSLTCGGEQQPEIKNFPLICAADLGILPNTDVDVSAVIQQSLPINSGIYFPAGRYIIRNDLKLSSKNSLVGSENGLTVFHDPAVDKSASVGDASYSPIVRDLLIKGIVFDNVTVAFYGNKMFIDIVNNAFINTIASPQVSVSHNPFNIDGNVFLRDEDHPGVALSTYKNTNTTVQKNIIGDISDDKQIATLNYYDVGSFDLVMKLKREATTGKIRLKEDQGNFVSAWYATDGLKKSKFRNNVIVGNTKSCLKQDVAADKCTLLRDHAVYIKQYDDVEVTNNYMQGWPRDASGQAKFRNATNLFFAGNYLEQVSFDARPYTTSPILKMDNTFVFNNRFNDSLVTYYQDLPNTDSLSISAKNFVVFSNVFESEKSIRILASWRNPQGEFLESNNLYTDLTPALVDPMFVNMDLNDAQSRLPVDKTSLLALQPIQLWKKTSLIEGPTLTENKLARLDIQMDGYPNQFVVYDPETADNYSSTRWIPELTKKFNSTIKGACAGVLADSANTVDTNSACKYMEASSISQNNIIYTTEGNAATHTVSVIDKFKKVGSIYAMENLTAEKAIKFTVQFEDGKVHEDIYTPETEYWMLSHRWPLLVAERINQIPGLCAGKYVEGSSTIPSSGKCSLTTPIASTYLNNIFTINGQSATTTITVINKP